jgi:hypothetical protein
LLKEVPIVESRKNLEFMEQAKQQKSNNQLTAISPSSANLPNMGHPGAPGSSSSGMMSSPLLSGMGAGGGVGGIGGAGVGTSGAAGGPGAGAGLATGANLTSPKGGGGDITSLIGVGLMGALNTNGFSNASALASSLFSTGSLIEESNFNKRLLSRFACYLIYALIKPTETSGELDTFGRIISMVLEWFHLVCYIPSDASGELISKIRTQFVLPWIKTVIETHAELVISCLLPFPPDFAKVGGVWETKSNRSIQIKEEFVKFCDLIPYEIVSYEVIL